MRHESPILNQTITKNYWIWKSIHIGCMYVGCPCCADDMVLLSSEGDEMQAMISMLTSIIIDQIKITNVAEVVGWR